MKQKIKITKRFLSFALAFIIISCSPDEFVDEMPNELTDEFVDDKVWGGHNQPSFERGESRVTISFNNQGQFIKNRTVLGTYEGTSIADTNAVFIELGNYTTQNQNIEIILNKRSWWDSWHKDMDEFNTSDVTADKFKYKNMTYQITGKSDEQETPGLDKFEEVYTK